MKNFGALFIVFTKFILYELLHLVFVFFFFVWVSWSGGEKFTQNNDKTWKVNNLGLKKKVNSMYFVISINQEVQWWTSPVLLLSPLSQKAGNSITPILPLLFIQWREVANKKDLGLAAATN